MSTPNPSERAFALTAMAYRSASAAAEAYEEMVAAFGREHGASLYRFQLGGEHTVAVLTWRATPANLAAITALPWGDGRPVELPADIAQRLALRSLEAAPRHPGHIRRIFRDPSGHVLTERELPGD